MMRVVVGMPPPQEFSKENSLASPAALARDEETRGLFRRKILAEAAAIEDLDWEKISIAELLALATTQSLMGDVYTYRLSGALGGGRGNEFLDVARDVVASPHQFIFTEEKLLKKPTDLVVKAGAEVVVYASKKKDSEDSAGSSFNIFSITYAFAARDRKKLWLLLHEALTGGVVPEAIAGMLHWKVRDMLSKKEKGKFSLEELRRISMELVSLYHDSHRGAGDLSVLLERYLLRL